LRERVKSKIYPVLEISLGASLSVQGVVLGPNSGSFSLLAGIVAFIGGVRIIIDGFKRLVEYRSIHLTRIGWYRYYWRRFKLQARRRLAPKEPYDRFRTPGG
jgi:hypothetical protein